MQKVPVTVKVAPNQREAKQHDVPTTSSGGTSSGGTISISKKLTSSIKRSWRKVVNRIRRTRSVKVHPAHSTTGTSLTTKSKPSCFTKRKSSSNTIFVVPADPTMNISTLPISSSSQSKHRSTLKPPKRMNIKGECKTLPSLLKPAQHCSKKPSPAKIVDSLQTTHFSSSSSSHPEQRSAQSFKIRMHSASHSASNSVAYDIVFSEPVADVHIPALPHSTPRRAKEPVISAGFQYHSDEESISSFSDSESCWEEESCLSLSIEATQNKLESVLLLCDSAEEESVDLSSDYESDMDDESYSQEQQPLTSSVCCDGMSSHVVHGPVTHAYFPSHLLFGYPAEDSESSDSSSEDKVDEELSTQHCHHKVPFTSAKPPLPPTAIDRIKKFRKANRHNITAIQKPTRRRRIHTWKRAPSRQWPNDRDTPASGKSRNEIYNTQGNRGQLMPLQKFKVLKCRFLKYSVAYEIMFESRRKL